MSRLIVPTKRPRHSRPSRTPFLASVLASALALVVALTPVVTMAESGEGMAEVRLNAVEVAVADRSTAARNAALREGLEQILVRITGQRSPGSVPGAEALLSQPGTWVEQFSYSTRGDNLRLHARFDLRGISEQLASAGAPVWGRSRPTVLVWVAADRGDILSRESSTSLAGSLQRQAAFRGLPLRLPEMDAEDRSRISAADVRGRFDRQIQNASQRYDAPLVVSAVYYSSGRPSMRWRLLQDGNSLRDGQLDASSEADLGDALVDAVADYLAELYAVRGGDASALVLRVEGLERLQAWHEVQQFVARQSGVRGVTLQRLAGSAAEMRLDFTGDPAQLERLLRLHQHLGVCRDAPRELPEAQTVTQTLRLCWQSA
ncbi:DUF2066 domain-containing protein [Alcanivorax sp. JB21]|uniref:DUF2066 domain-containing protein n=1 Tax=Alcanivorax limicola TaxID=2874102 RepID=UPI001CBF0D4F|nr:DUF2066 domain-containing protein [Alcanivorax limicola]MBZ2188302.1 DUF2066 domain-containing protein [Alcanivorax limicola]